MRNVLVFGFNVGEGFGFDFYVEFFGSYLTVLVFRIFFFRFLGRSSGSVGI